MAANDLAPAIAQSSSNMVLDMQDKWVFVFHKEGFQLTMSSQLWEVTINANAFVFLQIYSEWQGLTDEQLERHWCALSTAATEASGH